MANEMFNSLSDIQRSIVFKKKGQFVVKACPGSGKTYTVAARFAKEINNWDKKYQGIAAISFTNIAWQEIEKNATIDFKVQKPIPYPHFLGTIDRFINQFLFLPFGHLAMGCNKRPTLVGEPHGSWSSKNFREKEFHKMSYDIDGILNIGKIIVRGGAEKYRREYERAKIKLTRIGFASESDSNYYALRILEEYPQISKAIISRFPKILIDEAQDSSDIQMKIFDLLIENGLKEIMMVGDTDQAIFEFHKSNPKHLDDKFSKWKSNSIALNENRRSSQLICAFTYNLSSLNAVSNAINSEVNDYNYKPQIVAYNNNIIKKTIKTFLDKCREESINTDKRSVAIVARSKDLISQIAGSNIEKNTKTSWVKEETYIKDIIKAKYLWDKNIDIKMSFKIFERALLKKLTNTNYCTQEMINSVIESNGFAKYRKEIYSFITSLPRADGQLGDWVDEANNKLQNQNILSFTLNNNNRKLFFDDIYNIDSKSIDREEYKLGTIHSVKGETFDAVLIFLKTRGLGEGYKKMLNRGDTTKDTEEMRIVYVGITRPRKLLHLAVPEDDLEVWRKRLYQDG